MQSGKGFFAPNMPRVNSYRHKAAFYCSDGMQSPLVTGEQQWEGRWTLTASLQYNPVVTVPQDFADVLIPNLVIPADV